jgi:hypothetical protein
MVARVEGGGYDPAVLAARLVPAAIAAAVIACLLGSQPLHAAGTPQTWSGKGDGESWADAKNWASGAVPANGDSVVIAPTSLQTRPQVTGAPGGLQLQDLALTDSSLAGGALTVTGQFTWSVSQGYGSLGAPLTVKGTASISGAGEKDSKSLLRLEGATTITGPGLLSIQDAGTAVSNSGVLTLEPGATVKATVCCASTDELLNTGTIAVPAASAGKVSVGYMRFDDRGSTSIGPGSTLEVYAGPGQLGAGGSVTGGGTLLFDQGAMITVGSTVNLGAGSTLVLTGNAWLYGPGGLKGPGAFSWTGGTISGTLDVAATIHTTISGTGTKTLTSPTTKPTALDLHGPTTVEDTGDVDIAGTTSLVNLGTMTLKTGAMISGSVCCAKPDHVVNSGTLTVAAGHGTATITNVAFTNSGTVKIASGTLAAGNPGYRQTSGGSLVLTITGTKPGSQFGQVQVGGLATLAGALHVTPAGGFVPKHKQSFAVVVYRTRSGQFGSKSGSPSFNVAYGATAANVVYS